MPTLVLHGQDRSGITFIGHEAKCAVMIGGNGGADGGSINPRNSHGTGPHGDLPMLRTQVAWHYEEIAYDLSFVLITSSLHLK
jgi:hypothetical protein